MSYHVCHTIIHTINNFTYYERLHENNESNIPSSYIRHSFVSAYVTVEYTWTNCIKSFIYIQTTVNTHEHWTLNCMHKFNRSVNASDSYYRRIKRHFKKYIVHATNSSAVLAYVVSTNLLIGSEQMIRQILSWNSCRKRNTIETKKKSDIYAV